MKLHVFKDILIITIECRREDEKSIKGSLLMLKDSFNIKYKSVIYNESLSKPIINAEIRPNNVMEWLNDIGFILFCCFVYMLIQLGIALLK
ncbi:hypothetical protein G15_1313 [Enterococcus avium]|nr:hypothetical protein G15_1313 [Enterococcus avium]